MAEFKLNPALSESVASVSSAGGKLNIQSADLSGSSLSTAQKIAAQHREICTLLREYRELVEKDMNDLHTMIRHVQKIDADLASQ